MVIGHGASAEEGDASVDIAPLGRRASREIRSAVAVPASDDAVYITGAELPC
jgi:hypothetical protein